MCEPTTIVMVGMAVVGALTAYGQVQQGKAEAKYAEYEAKQGEADARAEAGYAKVEAERIRKMGKAAVAEATAATAHSGLDVSSAGALAINRDITRAANEDAYFALIGGKDRAARMAAQAALTRDKGKVAKSASYLNAGITLGKTALSMYGNGGGSGWKS
ncbi:hypothetical protein [Arenimonas sp.]|uniref:hypothetical protein n=1 Tax=Arenimonas sp. TaxID=1872635 RepID=UPI0039E6E913